MSEMQLIRPQGDKPHAGLYSKIHSLTQTRQSAELPLKSSEHEASVRTISQTSVCTVD